MLEHRSVVNFLESMVGEPGLGPEETLLAVTTLSFDIAGLELYLPLIRGARVVVAPMAVTVDAQRLLELIAAEDVSVMQATPATWRMLVDGGWAPGDTPGLRVLCGGEALPPALAEQLCMRAAEVWNLYGPTETTIWSTVQRIVPGAPVSIGRPIANTTLYVLDARRSPVPIGVTGELYIGGDGLEPHQRAGGPQRDAHGERAAGERQHHAFDEQLTHQPPAAGAERYPDGNLPPARAAAHEHEVGHIRAREQQHEAGNRHQHRQERGKEKIRAERAAPQRIHRHVFVAAMLLGIVLHLGLQPQRHLLLRLRRPHAGLQPSEHEQPEIVVIAQQVALGDEQRFHHQGHEQIRANAGLTALKTGGRHANDGVRMLVQIDRLADDVRPSAKMCVPQTVADDGDGCAARAQVFFRRERPPHGGAHAEHVEIVGRREHAPHPLGFSIARQAHRRHVDGRESDETLLTAPQRLQIRIRERKWIRGVAAERERHDVVRAGQARHRVQERRVDPAEDCRVRADAERQGQDDDRRIARRLGDHAQRKAQVVPERCHRDLM